MRRAAAFITIQIPRLEPTVRTQASPLPRAGRQQNIYAGLDQGLQQASNTINSIAAKEAAEQDASRIKSATSTYELNRNRFLYGSTDDNGQRIPGLMNTVGEQAVNPEDGITLDKKFQDWHKNYLEKTVPTLGNERQRQMFSESVNGSYASAEGAVLKHEYTQGQAVKIGNAKASVVKSTQTAIELGVNPAADPELYTQAQDAIKTSVKVQAMLQGYGENSEYAKVLLDEQMSKLHTNIIVTKISSDDEQGALDYYKEHSEDIADPEMKRQIGATIQKVKIRVEGKNNAAVIWDKYKPEGPNGLIDIEKMREEAEGLEASDTVREKTKTGIEERIREYTQNKAAVQDSVSNKIHKMASDGKSYDQIQRSIDLNDSIDDMAKDNLRNWADSKFKINEKKTEDKQKQSLEQMATLFAFQQQYLDGAYGTQTPQWVAGKAAELGQFTDNAMTFVEKVNNNLETAKVTDSGLKDLLYILGSNEQYAALVPTLDKPDAANKAKFAMLQGKVMQIMVDSQKAEGPGKGKTLQAATLEALTAVKTDDGFFTNTVEPYYLIGTDLATKYARGGDPSRWDRDAQDNYLRARWSLKPSNNGKTLSAAELEKMRQALISTGE